MPEETEEDRTSTGAEDFLASLMERRAAWPWYRKLWMQFRWKVAQPIDRFPREVRWFIQRGRRGWSDRDMWSMDEYVARVNVEMLARLREIAHGYPSNLSRGDNEPYLTDEDRERIGASIAEIDPQIGFDGDPNDGFERWLAMLAYFENGWRNAIKSVEEWDSDSQAEFEKMLPLYGRFFGSLWD